MPPILYIRSLATSTSSKLTPEVLPFTLELEEGCEICLATGCDGILAADIGSLTTLQGNELIARGTL